MSQIQNFRERAQDRMTEARISFDAAAAALQKEGARPWDLFCKSCKQTTPQTAEKIRHKPDCAEVKAGSAP